MITKIRNLNGTHNRADKLLLDLQLFMITKIRNLNGTHNTSTSTSRTSGVVYDYKDTKIVSNSQLWRYLY